MAGVYPRPGSVPGFDSRQKIEHRAGHDLRLLEGREMSRLGNGDELAVGEAFVEHLVEQVRARLAALGQFRNLLETNRAGNGTSGEERHRAAL